MTKNLVWEGVYPRISSLFFKVVVQSVLLFGSETCVLTPCMERELGNVTDHWNKTEEEAVGGGVILCW